MVQVAREGGCDGNGGGHGEAVKLTELLTWNVLRFLQSLLYVGLHCSLVSLLRTSSFAENYARTKGRIHFPIDLPAAILLVLIYIANQLFLCCRIRRIETY